MSKSIRIPTELYLRLEKHAKGFETPARVIEKILNNYENVSPNESVSSVKPFANRKSDKTKYLFDGYQYGKGRLVLAAVKKYVSENQECSFNDLLSVFPKPIQGSIGVINKSAFVQEKYADKQHKRHFVQPDDVIQLSDCNVVVCTEWGVDNINNFLHKIKELGYKATPIES